ncbi:MAG: hypothetical protein RL745_697 [Actinomycetota bacterium]
MDLPEASAGQPEMSDRAVHSAAFAADASTAEAADSSAGATSTDNVMSLPIRTYPVAAVARQLGIAAATLRTWARRHDLGASVQTAGGHRRYTDVDVMRLKRVQQLYSAGTTLDDAAALARSETPEQLESALARHDADVVEFGETQNVRELLRTAAVLNATGCKRIIERSIRSVGIVGAWDDLIVPTMNEVGMRWQNTGSAVEVEHLLSHCVTAVLAASAQANLVTGNHRPVLLACTPKELHSLPLLAIHAALAERQVESRVLGAQTPVEALVQAVHRSGPAVVVVWAQLPENADLECLRAIPAMRPPVRVIPAGPGWPDEVFANGQRSSSLTHTLLQIRQSLHA